MNATLLKKILSLTVLFIILFSPTQEIDAFWVPADDTIRVLEQQTRDAGGNPNTTSGAPRATPVNENTLQPINVNQGQPNSFGGGAGNNFASGGATSVSSCLASSGLVGAVQGTISNVVGGIADPFRVNTANQPLEGKDTGSILTGFISWDQMGWCMVNAMIEAVSYSTVEWINSGFEGNPTFVDDPEGYFTGLADMQFGQFIDELGGGFLCSPIQDVVRINLANSYNSRISPYGDRAQCSFTEISGNLDQFMSGETFGWEDWFSYTQNPYNNPMGATIYGQIELDRRIAQNLGIESTMLDWGAGFFSARDPETNRIVSPGTVIEDQINQRLFSGQRRLEIADEFNEVISTLVNQLIKTAVSEMTQR